MAIINGKYFKRELFLLKLAGLSLMGNDSFAYKIYSYLTVILMDIGHPTLQLVGSFKHDSDENSSTLYRSIASYQGFVKAVLILRYRKKIKEVIDKLVYTLNTVRRNPKTSSEQKQVKGCIRVATRQSLIYWSLMIGSIIATLLRCLINFSLSDNPDEWKLPYGELGLLNASYSRNFKILLGYQMLSMADIAVHYLAIDLVTATGLCHLSYHFRILRCRIVELVKRRNRSVPQIHNHIGIVSTLDVHDLNENPWNILNNDLKETVNYHTLIIKTAQEMESVFSNLLLWIMLNALFMLCLLIYFMTVVQLEFLELAEYFSHFVIISSQIFLLCFWGEQLSAESEKVALSVTEMDFVGCDLRFQKSLTLIMARSQRAVRFSAGNIAPLGLATFTWIMRNSYSAFVMLKNVNNH